MCPNMEIRDFANRVLLTPEIDAKLAPATGLTDVSPGSPRRVEVPNRPGNLQFAPRRTAPRMPAPNAMRDAGCRAVAHHIMANHELQALEVMAFVLLAFPDAPSDFRMGMTRVMADEQRHTRMHMERARALGISFGDLPVNCYIWEKAQAYQSVPEYLAGLPLTFEGRNLDHTLEFEDSFRRAEDLRSAGVMRSIHRDEIRHVAFGIEWLRKLKPPHQSDWEAYVSFLHWPMKPEMATGNRFHAEPRQVAGLDAEFIRRLEEAAGD